MVFKRLKNLLKSKNISSDNTELLKSYSDFYEVLNISEKGVFDLLNQNLSILVESSLLNLEILDLEKIYNKNIVDVNKSLEGIQNVIRMISNRKSYRVKHIININSEISKSIDNSQIEEKIKYLQNGMFLFLNLHNPNSPQSEDKKAA